jgi:hypothetical protein
MGLAWPRIIPARTRATNLRVTPRGPPVPRPRAQRPRPLRTTEGPEGTPRRPAPSGRQPPRAPGRREYAEEPRRVFPEPAEPPCPTEPIPALRSQADRASGRSPRVHGVTAPSRPSGGRTGTLSVRHELAAQTGGVWNPGVLAAWSASASDRGCVITRSSRDFRPRLTSYRTAE